MRTHPFLLGLSILVGSLLLVGSSEGKTLKGQVLLVRGEGTREPASPAMVSIVGIGNPDVTKEDGGFGVFVPDILQPDTLITLHVKFRNWVLSEPVEGEFRIPDNLDQTFVKILLVRKGAPELQSLEHMRKVLEKTLAESLTQVTKDGKAADFDPYAFAREWAKKNGVPLAVVLDLLRKLKNQYAQSDDPSKKGDAAIFNKRPDRAAEYFKQAAKEKEPTREELLREIERLKNKQGKKGHTPSSFTIYAVGWNTPSIGQIRKISLGGVDGNEAQLKALEQKLRRVTEEIVEDLRKAGNALYVNYEFEKARETYQKAFTYVTKESNPIEWASLLINIGNVNSEIAIRTEGEKIRAHFQESVKAYQQAQEVYSRETFPQAWAMTQQNLGTALADQGTRASGAESQRLLAEAVTAYRAALEVRTRATLPQDWAMTQQNLGIALADQGHRASGAESQRLLAEAVTAYRAALEVYTRTTLPQGWAMTQVGLGNALLDQGTPVTGAESQRLLAEAVTAYRAALEVFTREGFPSYWAMVRSNIVEAQLFHEMWGLVEQDVALLLPDPHITDGSKVALQVLLILALVGNGEQDEVPEALVQLRTRVASQPPGFLMTWSFEATKQFLHSQPQFASSRDWLLAVILAVEQHGRQAILEALDAAVTQFAEMTQN